LGPQAAGQVLKPHPPMTANPFNPWVVGVVPFVMWGSVMTPGSKGGALLRLHALPAAAEGVSYRSRGSCSASMCSAWGGAPCGRPRRIAGGGAHGSAT
jgi:hypothetical protein